jgi:pimeloyl-ACP methyl ester carboxylesterase
LKVFAMDMLGFGDSDKPVLDYSIELWRDMLTAFVAEVVGEGAVLVGNSVGSLVSLAAASKAGPFQILAVACLNCAGMTITLHAIHAIIS